MRTRTASLSLVLLACRQPQPVESIEPAPTPTQPADAEPAKPVANGPIAIGVSCSGGCALDRHGALSCWGGDATRHPGLRADVADDELLVATQVAFPEKIRDFAVTSDGVCWLDGDGVVRCHGAEGVEILDLGQALQLEATSLLDGSQVAVVQLDYQTLFSNIWHFERAVGEILDFDLGGEMLCVLTQGQQITCGPVGGEDDSYDGPEPFHNPDARELATAPWSVCALESTGEIACVPQFDALLAHGESPQIDGIDDAIAIDAGDEHGCALRAGGVVTCFGGNGYFQRGGTGERGVATVELPKPASAIAVDCDQSCALVDGEVLCWGATAMGRDDRRIARHDIALDSTALHISDYFSCVSRAQPTAVPVASGTRDTHVWCWGAFDVGSVGVMEDGIVLASQPRPVALPVPDIDGLVGWCFRAGSRSFCGDFQVDGQDVGAATNDFVGHELPEFATLTYFESEDWVFCGRTRPGTRPHCGWAPDELEEFTNAPTSGTLVLGPLGIACAFDAKALTCFDAEAPHAQTLFRSTALTNIRALEPSDTGWYALDKHGKVWRFSVEQNPRLDWVIRPPKPVPLGPAVEIAVLESADELCARDRDGAVDCITLVDERWSDVRREIDHGALELDAGIVHACARIDADKDGNAESLHCWGDNSFGQLGFLGDHILRTPTAISFR
jgi:hypothetical protein